MSRWSCRPTRALRKLRNLALNTLVVQSIRVFVGLVAFFLFPHLCHQLTGVFRLLHLRRCFRDVCKRRFRRGLRVSTHRRSWQPSCSQGWRFRGGLHGSASRRGRIFVRAGRCWQRLSIVGYWWGWWWCCCCPCGLIIGWWLWHSRRRRRRLRLVRSLRWWKVLNLRCANERRVGSRRPGIRLLAQVAVTAVTSTPICNLSL